ncbi:MAG: DNA-binding response regulator [Thalassobius sp.]|nr:DNA-binding response regulator [Thalassovita sp.]
MNLKCIAIDDEPLALELVNAFIEKTPFLEKIGLYDNALTALQSMQQNEIDLIFLDIEMSDLSGIEMARILNDRPKKPLIIFTTAFDQFAIEGYKLDVIDYLLKPFNYNEFLRAAMKAKSHSEMLKQPKEVSAEADIDYIFLKVEYQLVKVMLKDINYIEGYKDYVRVHVTTDKYPILSLSSLKSLEDRLPAKKFFRIHRSYIVSIDKIKAVTKTSVQIEDKNLTISENYRKEFHDFIKSGY